MKTAIAAFTVMFFCAFNAGAADPAAGFPDRPIRLVVGFAPGGAPDIIGRLVGQKLGERLGQQIVVDNRPGATGNIGAEIVARAAPNGHTLFMATVSVAISPNFYKSLPFDPVGSFAPVSRVAIVPLLVVVHPSLPVKSIRELIEHAKSKPGVLNYASVGTGSPQHLSAELFKSTAGVNLVHVPYKGGGPATAAILSGESHLFFAGMPPALPHARAGRLRALAVSTAKRSPSAPEVPTVAEAGLPGFEADNWHGVLAPRGTPPAVVAKLNREIVAVLSRDEIQKQLIRAGAEGISSSPDAFAKFIRTETGKWAAVAKQAGVSVR
ncbi:MAG: tripartite tricarboxylate transporter substrate binding protein [Burkholderiales bacterium]